ncbi:MAG: flagellar type III secretion system pore protein FliP [Planctomycetota bacterium]|nr:flagellar type III secretion system pore protein FliP [Planctomycetota bacterium]
MVRARILAAFFAASMALSLMGARAHAEDEDRTPKIEINFGEEGGKRSTWSTSIKVVVMMTLISIAPALLILTTSFTRTIIVLGFMRHALSTQQLPPNIVLIGLSLFLTMFIMTPVWNRIYEDAYVPYQKGDLTEKEAMERAAKPIRTFMGHNTRKKDLALFLELSRTPQPETFDDVPSTVLAPAFVISELRTAFQMGFLIFLPFIIIDLVVASTLMSLGMVMLPPAMISLPLKILLFVLADGWRLLVQAIVTSFVT